MRLTVRWIGIWMAAVMALSGLATAGLAESRMGISDGQRDQLKALASNTRDRTGRERDAMRRARMELFEIYSKYDIDERKARAARDKVSAAQLSLLNIHLDNEIALRNVFNADQFRSFGDLMKKRFHNPEMLVLSAPEDALLDRLPDKAMLTDLGIEKDDQKRLKPNPQGTKAIRDLGRDTDLLLDLYSSYTLDSAAARKLIDGIHQEQIALLTAQDHRQKDIRDVLSEDQFQKLKQEIMKRITGRAGRRGPRR